MAQPLVTFQVTEHGLDRLQHAPELMVRAEALMLERAVTILTPLAQSEAPSRTGRGRSRIRGYVSRISGRLVGRVGPSSAAFYLRILAVGATAHEISPFRFTSKTKQRAAMRAQGPGRSRGAIRALRFEGGGGLVFRRLVQHPGAAQNPFLERASRRGDPAVAVAADRIVEDLLIGGA